MDENGGFQNQLIEGMKFPRSGARPVSGNLNIENSRINKSEKSFKMK